MFEKFKEKCKAFTRNRAAVVTVIVLVLALTVVLSVSIATNRAKKQYAIDDVTDTSGNKTTDLGIYLELGEWFNLRLEVYEQTDDGFKVKVFVNGSYVYPSSNYLCVYTLAHPHMCPCYTDIQLSAFCHRN